MTQRIITRKGLERNLGNELIIGDSREEKEGILGYDPQSLKYTVKQDYFERKGYYFVVGFVEDGSTIQLKLKNGIDYRKYKTRIDPIADW